MQRPKQSAHDEYQKAVNHHRQGNFRQAENTLKRILKKDIGNAAAQNLLGMVYLTQGQIQKAVRPLQSAVRLDAENARYRYDLGNSLKARRDLAGAIEQYEKALEINDRVGEIHNNLGTTLLELGDNSRAEESFEQAIAINPTLFQPHLNMGNIHRDRDAWDEAAESYKRAIELNSQSAEAHNNLGHVLLARHREREGIAHLRKALEIDPDLYEANANLKHQEDRICEWRAFDTRNAVLEKHTQQAANLGKKPPVTPFQQLARSDDKALNLRVAQLWGHDYAAKMSSFALQRNPGTPRAEGGKIRLGYLSADFRDHPAGRIMAQLIARHDRNRFDVTAFSIGKNDNSAVRDRIVRDSDTFVDLETDSDLEAAQRIYDRGTDILVDLMGYTDGYRMEIPALRPAPVQASFLGFPGTTGADFYQYLIADRFVCPPGDAAHYSEKLAALPHSYMICPYADDPPPPDRDTAGFDGDTMVFCSFNQPYKIDPVLFDVWMAILRAVEDSVLWLNDTGQSTRENLRREAAARDVSGERLVFAPRVPELHDHLQRLQRADIALDTRLYNGHVTTVDALYAGVPVVSLAGRHFPSRVAAGILRAVGLPELVASDLDEYRTLAIELARDPAKRTALRQKIKRNRQSSPVFDLDGYVRDIETLFGLMWRRHVSGEPPSSLAVPTKN